MNRKATFAKRQRETDLKDHARQKEARRVARKDTSRTGKGPEIAWDEAVYETKDKPEEEGDGTTTTVTNPDGTTTTTTTAGTGTNGSATNGTGTNGSSGSDSTTDTTKPGGKRPSLVPTDDSP
jgi:hypothetical protein